MKPRTWFTTAGTLIAIGTLIALVGLALVGFDGDKLSDLARHWYSVVHFN
ncbi:hypothetical protein [Lacticaseibacillus absianus]|nr:hypothetical protein [Lacticaseibacillus absianus]